MRVTVASLKLLLIWVFVGFLTSSHTHFPERVGAQKATAVTDGNITYPAFLEEPIKAAYAQYVELKNSDIHIYFQLRDKISKSIMQAQPVLASLFSAKEKREYRIKVSRYINIDGKAFAIEDIPAEVLTGWFAHELGHIQDYLDRSSTEMVWFGLRYVTSEKFLKEAEWRADQNAIDAGFIEQLVQMRNYINPENGFEQPYCDRIGLLYPTCDKLLNYFYESEPSADYDPEAVGESEE